jgi:small subunit ribosomal protein S6
MKNRYEALLVLNTQGREDTVKDVVDRLESEFQKEGAEIEQVQKMDKRQFAYVAGELDAGHYVNFVFHADSQLITKLRAKFKLARKAAWPVSIKLSFSGTSRAIRRSDTPPREQPSRI